MKFWQLVFIFFIISIKSTFLAFATPHKDEIIANLTNEWLFYDNQKDAFLPLLPDLDYANGLPIHLIIKANEKRGTYLYIEVYKGSYLLINNLLVENFSSDTWHEISLDKLHQYGNDILITLYTNNQTIREPIAYWTKSKQSLADLAIEKKAQTIHYRTRASLLYRDFLVSLSLVIMIFIALSTTWSEPIFYGKIWLDKLTDFLRPIRFSVKQSTIETIIFLFLGGLILGHSVLIFEEYSSFFEKTIIGKAKYRTNIFSFSFHFIALFFQVLFIFIGKYALVWLFTHLQFNSRQVMQVHFQIFIRYGKIFMALNFILSSLLSLNAYRIDVFWVNFAFFLMLFGMLLHSIIISFFVIRTVSLKKSYLFSYLCGTEFIPLFLIIKLFL